MRSKVAMLRFRVEIEYNFYSIYCRFINIFFYNHGFGVVSLEVKLCPLEVHVFLGRTVRGWAGSLREAETLGFRAQRG